MMRDKLEAARQRAEDETGDAECDRATAAPRRVRPARDRARTCRRSTSSAVPAEQRTAIAELLLTLADDEFVQGFWTPSGPGSRPMLEEDVAFSSLAQDEIGHARAFYELRARLTGEDPDEVAFGRPVDGYRHARLLDHPRTTGRSASRAATSTTRPTHVRLGALAQSSFRPLADLVAKVRREETYHLMHLDAWIRRLAEWRR